MLNRILYIQHTNPANYPPLQHSAVLFSKAGWQPWFFGIESEGESNKLKLPETLVSRQILWPWVAPGLWQKARFLAFTLAALCHAIRLRARWVYCSDPMSCPAGWLILKLTRCHVIYHEHDSPLNQTPGPRAISSFQRFLLWTRRVVGREADAVVLPNSKRLELFLQNTDRQRASFCVCNCPLIKEVSDAQPPRVTGPLRILLHGSLNYDQPPPLLLEVMAEFGQAITLTVAGYPVLGSRDCMDLYMEKAKRLGLENNLRYLGALPRHELMSVVKEAHVGLALFPLETDNVNLNHLTGASNKAFDYLAGGLALLVSARPDWEEKFVRPGYGLSCNPNDANSIAAQLRWFLEHPAETREMGERGRQRLLTEWNYEKQFSPVLGMLNHSAQT